MAGAMPAREQDIVAPRIACAVLVGVDLPVGLDVPTRGVTAVTFLGDGRFGSRH